MLGLRWIALAAACVAGCSSGGEAANGSTGDAGAVARGAVDLEVYATEEQSCPPGNVHVDIGHVTTSPPDMLAHGVDGARVECAVVQNEEKFAASGTVARGAASFSFRDVVTAGASAIGHVEVVDPASGIRYASSEAHPCLFQFSATSGQGIGAGRIDVGFDCSDLVSAADPSKSCSSRYGSLRLEACAQAK